MTATERALNDTMTHIKALNAADSYRVLAKRFNVPFYTLRDLACGRFDHVSWDTLLLVRMRLGLPDLPPLHYIEGCPSCGGDHGLQGIPDCHGKPIAAVVTLAPDEAVIKRNGHAPKRERKARKSISLDPAVWEASNARRIAAGMTWDEWEGR